MPTLAQEVDVRARALAAARRRRSPTPAVALLLGALIAVGCVALAFSSGGFFAGRTGVAEAVAAVALALWVIVAPRPLAGVSPAIGVAVAALGAFALWVLLSGHWSHAPARALLEGDRALLYALVVALAGAVSALTRVRRALVVAVSAALALVAIAGLVTRLAPDLWPIAPGVEFERLSYPLGYWNGQGALAGLGIVACLGLAGDRGRSLAVRIPAAAVLPLLCTTVLLTFSRGAIGATVVGVALLVWAARDRGSITALVAAVPFCAVAVVATYRTGTLVDASTVTASATAAGHRIAVVVLACAAGAAGALALATRIERRTAGRPLPRLPHPRVVTVTLLLVVVAGAFAVGLPGRAADRVGDITQSTHVAETGDGRHRLTQLSDNGRIAAWRVSLDSFAAAPLHGSGAGTFALAWARERPSLQELNDGHSLLFETLGELGVVGVALLGLALAALLRGCVVTRRGPQRAVAAIGLAVLGAWLVHACIDWDWELPALTIPALALAAAAAAAPGDPAPPGVRRGAWAARGVAVAGLAAIALLGGVVALSQGRLDAAVAAVHAGRCAAADDAARASIAIDGQRPEPHSVLAACALQSGDGTTALREIRTATRLDPGNWRLLYDLAVVRGALGQDPRPALRAARVANPRSWLLRQAMETVGGGSTPTAWRAAALRADLLI